MPRHGERHRRADARARSSTPTGSTTPTASCRARTRSSTSCRSASMCRSATRSASSVSSSRSRHDFDPGHRTKVFDVNGKPVGTVICFESAFTPLMRASVRKGAEAIVVTTNNRSYRRSPNSAQHVALSQMSAAAVGPTGAPRVDLGHHRGHRRRTGTSPGPPGSSTTKSSPARSPRCAVRPRMSASETGWSGSASSGWPEPWSWRSAAVDSPRPIRSPRERTVSDEQNPLERAVDLFVFAPIGVAMFAKDTVPTFMKMFVSRGQTEIAQRKKSLHDQANQYRTVGRFAVKYGGPVVKQQAEEKLDGARRLAEETFSGRLVGRGGADEASPAPAPTPTPVMKAVPEPKIETSSTSITNGATNGAVNGNGNGSNGKTAPAGRGRANAGARLARRAGARDPRLRPALRLPSRGAPRRAHSRRAQRRARVRAGPPWPQHDPGQDHPAHTS